MFGRKGKEYTWLKTDAGKRFESYLQNLRIGDYRYLGNVFCTLADKKLFVTEKAAEIFCDCLNGMSFNEIIKADSMMRDTSSMEWFYDWRSIRLDSLLIGDISAEERRAILIFASFHPNGFIREQAIKMLADCAGSLPYLILRTNDWVSQVRQATKVSIASRLNNLSTGELVAALPYFEKMKAGKRSQNDYDVKMFYDKLLEPEQEEDLTQGLNSNNQFTRRLCLNALLAAKPLDSNRILFCLKSEKIPFIRYSVYKRLLWFDFPERQNTLDNMLKDKYPRIRKVAFEALAKQDDVDFIELAKIMLLDRYSEVRDTARYYISKSEPAFDFRDFYIASLENNPASYASICGLGETGNKRDALIAENYLKHHLNSAAKAGMYACLRLNSEKYFFLIVSMLDDERSGISKQAYKLTRDLTRLGVSDSF